MGQDRELSDSQPAGGTLSSPSFLGLMVTQFLGALNDNMFRWLVVSIAEPTIKTAALPLGLACFTSPYLVFASFAGFLGDRFSKRTVIVGCKIAEAVIMALGVAAILTGSVELLFVVVALMGSQSALFGPSKLGAIPELVDAERISKANGWMALTTVVASALGCIVGFFLYSETGKPSLENPGTLFELWLIPAALVGTAVAGTLTSLLIRRLPAADPQRRLTWNPVGETWANLRLLGRNRPLMRTALGMAFFWALASLVQMNIAVFGKDELQLNPENIGPLMALLTAGVGLGSVLAGYWSGDRVELGIVPLGALGIVIFSSLLYLSGSNIAPDSQVALQTAYVWSCVWLFFLGASAGLFNIPLSAYMQHRSERQHRGVILAGANFVTFTLILLVGGLFYLLQEALALSASQIFLFAALSTIPVLIYIVVLLPGATIRFVAWLITHTIYRVRVWGRDNVPETGGALLVSNHVSWIDAVLLLVTSSRPIRMLMYADYMDNWRMRWLARIYGIIPISDTGGPKELVKSLQTARKAIQDGDLVCIFAEGVITRTGQLQPFNRGMMHVIKGTDAPVIPVYLDGLWGSIFSYRGGRLLWKRPRQFPYPVAISFGIPIETPDDVHVVHSAVANLGVESVERRKDDTLLPARRFLRMCRRTRFRNKIADTSGTELTGGKLLTAALAFKRVLERNGIGKDEDMVGVFVPPSNGGVIANAALALMGKVAVNLNYTMSEDVVNYCAEQCKIRHVLTSRRFLEKKPFNLTADVVYLEDLKEQISGWDKFASLFAAYVTPIALLERSLGLKRIKADDLLTVLFTSGSTGQPKGVMLSQHNVMSNIQGIDDLYHLTNDDVLLGILPFFHSFGFTGNLWLALTLSPKAVFHINPLESRMIGKLCEKHRVTIMMATPTFLRSYLKRCTPEQFAVLDTVVTGAEKLPIELAKAFQEKFGVEPSEGYGTTELSPVAAVNVPEHRTGGDGTGQKMGTVGRPFPGVAAKVVDPDTFEDLGINAKGLLLIGGPNVMQGYLNEPEKTAEVIRDGWYNTGDIARIDDEGFIEITGRQSRFSKIGGEMVPHIRIEEELNRILEDPDDEEARIKAAVTSVPHPTKGERIIVLHTPFEKPLDEVLKELGESGLPNLWIPARDGFLEIEEIPILGTGKLDLKAIKQLALDCCG